MAVNWRVCVLRESRDRQQTTLEGFSRNFGSLCKESK
jgi:hypothetical protein